jgi:UDP-N-acetylmuramate--alanine ligase
LGEIDLQVPGAHNVLNALAAVAVGLELEIGFDRLAQALGEFQGADRRFQLKGELGGVLVVDDYGHHPTEIAATLAAAKGVQDRRLVVVFQPHRYSRTQHLLEEFPKAFNQADVLILTEIYAAGEPPIPGISGRLLADVVKQHGHRQIHFAATLDQALQLARQLAKPGDLLITLGAGDVWKVGERYLQAEGS